MLFVRIVRCPFTRWMIHIHKIKTASSHIFKPSYLLFWWSDLHKIFRICFWDHFSGFENVSSTDALCKKHSRRKKVKVKYDLRCAEHTAPSIFTKFDFLSKHCSQWPDSVMCSTYKKLIPEGAAHFVKVTSQQLYMQSQTLISINIEKPRFIRTSCAADCQTM